MLVGHIQMIWVDIYKIYMLGVLLLISVQNLLSSSLLSKNLKIRIYRTIILPVVLCECETWSLTLRKERRLRVLRIGC